MSAPLIVEPSACTWCGIARHGHGRQYADAVGWHEWEQPSQEQILARMKARRLQLAVAKAGALPVPVGGERTLDVVADDLTAEWQRRAEAAEARIAGLEAQRERRRVRLVALQNDALNMRGSLSPMGEDRKVPFPLGETLTPAVDWLIARVAELEVARSAVFLARRDSQVLGLYTLSEDALHHCENALGRTTGYSAATPFSWRKRPDGTRELYAWTSQEVESATGFTVARLGLRDEFDEGWGADADVVPGPDAGSSAERPVNELTAVFSPVASLREPEPEFHAFLYHPYTKGHDQPETGVPLGSGACKACGSPPEQWCPDCGCCQKGCDDGHVDNPCTHANASWGAS